MNHPVCARVPVSLRVTLAFVVTALPATGQSGAWAADTAAPGLGGRVFSFGSWQGETYAGGYPFAAQGGEIACLARWNGTSWQRVGTGIDLVGGWASFATPTIRAMCEYQGSLYVAGTFDVAGGQPRNNIARWDGTSFHALGQGLVEIGWDADVRALAVYNGELYATGQFTTAGGLPANGIARWNGSSWSTCGSGLGLLVGNPGLGRSLHVVGNDLVVGGEFVTAGGVAASCVARWNGTSFAPMGAGFDGEVRAMADYGGQLVVGGSFSNSGSTPIYGPAFWTGSAWLPFGPGAAAGGPTPTITSMQVLGTDLYVGGSFTTPGPCLARWNGNAWANVGGVAGVFSGSINTIVLALGVHGTDLLVGGEFTRGGDPPQGPAAVVSTNVVAFDGTAWQPMGSTRGVHGSVFGMVPFGPDWIAYGSFDEAGAVATRALARFDGDRWHAFGECDGIVGNVVPWNGGLVVNGQFAHIGGQSITNSAFFDGATWAQFGPPISPPLAVHQGQLYAAASTDLRRWNGSTWVTVWSIAAVIERLHAHVDGFLYFTTATLGQYRIWRWDGTTATVIGTANDFADCLGSYGNDLVVGGRFTTINGAATSHLARWNGSTWSKYGTGIAGYTVASTCVLDGQLYVGANGDPRGFLLRWSGTAWSAVPGNLSGLPGCLFPDPTIGSVHVFGGIHFAGGLPVENYGEWRNQPRWRNRLHGLPGANGLPLLRGTGTLQPGTPWHYTITAEPGHLGLLALGLSRVDSPVLGGTLLPSLDLAVLMVGDANGVSTLAAAWPTNAPPGVAVFAQGWLLDATGPQGVIATAALECIAP